MFALAEAKALVIQHRDVALAIANALMAHKTFDTFMIHQIIASAPAQRANPKRRNSPWQRPGRRPKKW
jgi:hypothetical protein